MTESIEQLYEHERLVKLSYYEILDTPAEKAFDQISLLATDIFDVANAGICFVDDDRIFVKSQIGNQLSLTHQDFSLFLNHDIKVFMPEELAKIKITESFLVTAPLKSADGFVIGFLYASGNVDHPGDVKSKNMLAKIAEIVMDKLETRIAIRKTLTAQDDRLHVLIHDLKNPMTTISLQSELVSRMPNVEEKVSNIAGKINLQSKRMVENLNEILSSAKKINGTFKPQKLKVDLRSILLTAITRLNKQAAAKNQTFEINIHEEISVFGDPDKLEELFYQLVHNGLKFSHPNTTLYFSHQLIDNFITIAIKDEGVGLTENDLDDLFIKFAPLSAVATAHENTNGLGLTLAKMFIDMHKGKLWAKSGGKNKGTTFFVQLPIK